MPNIFPICQQMLQLRGSSLVPAPRLPAEEAAAGQAACHCPPGPRFDWILISDGNQTARPMGRRRRGNQAWAPQASLAAVWYRLIVTSRPRHSSPGDAARVCGARAGLCRVRGSAFRAEESRGPGDETQARLELRSRSLESAWVCWAHTGAGSVTELKWAESSRARLDISRDHAISGTVHCSGRGYEPWAPAPPPPSRLWADLGEWAAQWCHERWDDLNKNIESPESTLNWSELNLKWFSLTLINWGQFYKCCIRRRAWSIWWSRASPSPWSPTPTTSTIPWSVASPVTRAPGHWCAESQPGTNCYVSRYVHTEHKNAHSGFQKKTCKNIFISNTRNDECYLNTYIPIRTISEQGRNCFKHRI